MRPKKIRIIRCSSKERLFRPKGIAPSKLESVILSLDEFEAVRLADVENLQQLNAAEKMQISRPTFSRILTSAYKKIADSLVNLKEIKIEGGCCKKFKQEKK